MKQRICIDCKWRDMIKRDGGWVHVCCNQLAGRDLVTGQYNSCRNERLKGACGTEGVHYAKKNKEEGDAEDLHRL